MQIGSDDASLHASLPAVGAVVALADQDFAERCGVPAEGRPSTVVVKTHQRAGPEVLQVGLDDNVADEALLPSLGPDVDQADAVEAFAVGGLVVMAEQVVATANREDRGGVPNRARVCLLLGLSDVVTYHGVVAI